MISNIGTPEILLILILFLVIIPIPYWKIYTRTGQSGVLALLQYIPVVNIIMLFILAFGTWPIEKELDELRRMKNPPDNF